MSSRPLREWCKAHRIQVDMDGRLYRRLSLEQCQRHMFRCYHLLLFGCIMSILKRYTFYPVTIIGDTVYSHVVATTLTSIGTHYIWSGAPRQMATYYRTTEPEPCEIQFDGCGPHRFKNIVMFPHSQAELDRLSEHTGLTDLDAIQAAIIGDVGPRTVSASALIGSSGPTADPILHIKRVTDSVYFIRTRRDAWLTRLIICDGVAPLQPEETVLALDMDSSGLDVTSWLSELLPPSVDPPESSQDDTTHEVTDGTTRYRFRLREQYRVTPKLEVVPVSTPSPELLLPIISSYETIPVYYLKSPRPWNRHMFHIHPYHLPVTWNPFLALMIITVALVRNK